MFDMVLNKPMDQYVWELVFGEFNLFFSKFIHLLGMPIVECYDFNGFVAIQLKKVNYVQLLSNLIVHLLFIIFFISPTITHATTYVKIKSYIFVHGGPPLGHNDVTKLLRLLHYCYVCYFVSFLLPQATYYVCYDDVLSRYSIGLLALITFFWEEEKFIISI